MATLPPGLEVPEVQHLAAQGGGLVAVAVVVLGDGDFGDGDGVFVFEVVGFFATKIFVPRSWKQKFGYLGVKFGGGY